ncbi:MAG: 50S ribosomal protein L17 [Candidatus Omnitrophota bacterium]
MRHAQKRYQLNRSTSWHHATLKSLVRSLLIHQSIKTTLTKAKAARPLAEKLIGLAKKNTLAAKREAFSILGSHQLVSLIFKEFGQRFAQRQSGFIRIINLGNRRGDNAKMVIFQLSEIKIKEIKNPKKQKEEKREEQPEKTGKPAEEKIKEPENLSKEKPPISKKPSKNFLGGLRNIFKKERDSL